MTTFPEWIDPVLRRDYIRDGYVYDLYDGDTVYYHAELGYNTWAAFQIGRLLDVWAPEVRPLVTRADGLAAKKALSDMLNKYALNRHDEDSLRIGRLFKLRSVQAPNKWFRGIPQEKKGKYGRWLIVLIGADDEGRPYNVNEAMVATGLARSTA